MKLLELEVLGPYDLAKVRSKLLQTQRAMGSIIFHMAMTFVGCMIVGSLVDAIVQIVFSEVMAEIVIAITAISDATLVKPYDRGYHIDCHGCHGGYRPGSCGGCRPDHHHGHRFCLDGCLRGHRCVSHVG